MTKFLIKQLALAQAEINKFDPYRHVYEQQFTRENNFYKIFENIFILYYQNNVSRHEALKKELYDWLWKKKCIVDLKRKPNWIISNKDNDGNFLINISSAKNFAKYLNNKYVNKRTRVHTHLIEHPVVGDFIFGWHSKKDIIFGKFLDISKARKYFDCNQFNGKYNFINPSLFKPFLLKLKTIK